jgi:hypothetical protein
VHSVQRESRKETWERCAERDEREGDDRGGRLERHGWREEKMSVRLLIWVRMTNKGGLTLQ